MVEGGKAILYVVLTFTFMSFLKWKLFEDAKNVLQLKKDEGRSVLLDSLSSNENFQWLGTHKSKRIKRQRRHMLHTL